MAKSQFGTILTQNIDHIIMQSYLKIATNANNLLNDLNDVAKTLLFTMLTGKFPMITLFCFLNCKTMNQLFVSVKLKFAKSINVNKNKKPFEK